MLGKPTGTKSGWSPRAAALCIAVLSTLAYANSFHDIFAGLDARESIRDNPHIRTLWPLSEAMSLEVLQETIAADVGSKGGTVVRRPILSLSFAINYQLTGMHAVGFHAINLIVHILAAITLFGVVRRTLLLTGNSAPPASTIRRDPTAHSMSTATGLALAASCLWAVHPLTTEAVTYLVQRAESLMSLFLLLTLYASARAFDERQRPGWTVAAMLACALGMGTKETMAVAPLVVLAYDYVFVSGSLRNCLQRHGTHHFALALTWSVIILLVATTLDDTLRDFEEGGTLAYFSSQPSVLLHYLRLVFWPEPLHLYVNTHRFEVHPGLTPAIDYLAPMVVVGAGVVVVLRAAWRRNPYGFLGLAGLLILAPSSSVVATSDILQEHRMYLPSAALIVATVLFVEHRFRQSAWIAREALFRPVLVAILVAMLGARTLARNADYADEWSMLYPGDLQNAYLTLADHYDNRGELDEAIATARVAASRPEATTADRAYAGFLQAFAAEAHGDLDAAIGHFEQVTLLQPNQAHAWIQLGAARMQEGDYDQAKKDLLHAVDLRPLLAEAHTELAVALRFLADHEGARRHFAIALLLRPASVETRIELGSLLLEMGDREGAAEQFVRAQAELETLIAKFPENLRPRMNLAMLHVATGDADAAVSTLEQALARHPDEPTILSELGSAELERGNHADAIAYLQRALALRPQSISAQFNLGLALFQSARLEEAAARFYEILALDPDSEDAKQQLDLIRKLQDGNGA